MEGNASEHDTAEHDSEQPRSHNMWARLRDRLSFGATLVAVAAVAIFIGWLLGQYAIQAVTGPRLVSEPMARPTDGVDIGRATRDTAAPGTPITPTTGGMPPTASPSSPSAPSTVAETPPARETPSTTSAPTPAPSSSATNAAPSSAATSTATGSAAPSGGFWRVQAGAFSDRNRADSVVSDLHALGFEAVVTLGAQPVPYRVQVGAFRDEARARAIVEDLRAAGFEAAVFAPN